MASTRRGIAGRVSAYEAVWPRGEIMTNRQAKASTLILIGFVLIVATEPLANAFSNSASVLLMAGIHSLSPLGLIFLVIGIYRAATKGKQP